MKIHQVEEHEEKRYELDPQRGAVLKTYTNVQRSGAAVISDPEHGEFAVDETGTFDVPDELGEKLVVQPGWNEGVNPFSEEIQSEVKSGNEAKAKAKTKTTRKKAPEAKA
jgi:hypothetical protein